MNAVQFLLADGRQSGVWYCTKCMKTKASMNREMAERCCVPIDCDYCGKPIDKDAGHYTATHHGCSHLRQAEREATAIAKAEKLDDWNEWVFLDGIGPQDGYFDSLESLVDYLVENEDEDDQRDWPEWVFTCKSRAFVAVDADHIIENIGEDSYEDWDAEIKGEDEFRAACKAFNESNNNQLIYNVDRRRVVKMPPKPIS
jgi:hypothetical protein